MGFGASAGTRRAALGETTLGVNNKSPGSRGGTRKGTRDRTRQAQEGLAARDTGVKTKGNYTQRGQAAKGGHLESRTTGGKVKIQGHAAIRKPCRVLSSRLDPMPYVFNCVQLTRNIVSAPGARRVRLCTCCETPATSPVGLRHVRSPRPFSPAIRTFKV